ASRLAPALPGASRLATQLRPLDPDRHMKYGPPRLPLLDPNCSDLFCSREGPFAMDCRRDGLDLRAERQAEGIAAARRRQAEGRMLPGKKHIGRPKVTGPAEITALRRLVDDGTSVT